MITVKIDGTQVKVKDGTRIIEIADNLKIPIPRFCYHNKLSVAANCRMCLVEVANVAKLLPACSTQVSEGMQIFTKSPKTIAGQKSIMELLLVNHPLDCPVCDQAGECELQDLSLQFGKDGSRYREPKRTVKDQNLGPLIATNMTRCIHCTRCVRFGEEIAGVKELGAIHRGESMKITTCFNQPVTSEVSGNIIDLCPVGALTSKPFMYSARSWQLKQVAGVSCHDCLGSNIYYHINNGQIKRAVPAENSEINSIWLSDRDRFGFIGINAPDRLKHPLLKKDDKWCIVSWEEALSFIHNKLSNIIAQYGADNLGGLIWPNATLEECFLFQKLFKDLGSYNVDHRLRQLDFRGQDMAPLYPNLGLTTVAQLADQKIILLIGCHINKEQPIAGIYVRAATIADGKVIVINPVDFKFNFDVYHKYITPYGDLLTPLIRITKAIIKLTNNSLPTGANELLKNLSNIEYNDSDLEIAKQLLSIPSGQASIILGSLAISHPEYSRIVAISNLICFLTNAKFGSFSDGANSAGAWLAGCVAIQSLNARQMLQTALKAYILLGIEPELDCIEGIGASNAMMQADLVVAITCFESDLLLNYSDVLLPMAAPQESGGTYVNVTGAWQSFEQIVPLIGDSKPATQILMMLAEKFDYNFTDINILEIIKQSLASKMHNNSWRWWCPAITDYANNITNSFVRISPMSLYATDPIVRRSSSLQETKDAAIEILINQKSANFLDFEDLEIIKIISFDNLDNFIQAPIKISNNVPEGCILINQVNTRTLIGIPYSRLILEKLVLEKSHA